MNIIDYVRAYDKTMIDSPLTEVDSLVLSQLAYFSFKENKLPCKLKEDPFFKETEEDLDNMNLITSVIGSPRFGNIMVDDYQESKNQVETKQFSAVTFLLETGECYLAFRGTDGSVVGWKEDFNMAFICPVPSQSTALSYVVKQSNKRRKTMYLGGHSKGGNLAVYAACMAPIEVKKRIKKIFSHDGPGLQREMFYQEEYRAVEAKIKKTVPASSLIGMLLYHREPYSIVKSNRFGIMQHDPFSWEIEKEHFVLVKSLTDGSIYINQVIANWLESLKEEERESFVNAFFEVFEKSGINTFKDFGKLWYQKIPAFLFSMQGLTDEAKEYLWQMIKSLIVMAIKTIPEAL